MLFCTYSSKLLQPELGVRAKLSPSDRAPLLCGAVPRPAAAVWNGKEGGPASAAAATARPAGLLTGLPDAVRPIDPRGATCRQRSVTWQIPKDMACTLACETPPKDPGRTELQQ